MNTVTTITALLTALGVLIANVTALWLVIRPVKRQQVETHAVVAKVANGQATRIDQLEQTLQEVGAPIPPAPVPPAETP